MDQKPGRARLSLVRWLVPVAAVLGLAAWLYVAPPGLMGKLDAIGYAVCHRIDSHSLHIGALQMPLCARCTGEFNAAAIGLLFQGLVSPRKNQFPKRGILAVLGAALRGLRVRWIKFLSGLDKRRVPRCVRQHPQSVCDHQCHPSLHRQRHGTGNGRNLISHVQPKRLARPAAGAGARLATHRRTALPSCSLMDVAMLTENPLVLYPVAVISSLGVLALLCLVFSVVWIMIMRQDNAFDHLRQLWLPAVAGLTLAFVLILGIDLFRLSLTHTWGGFPGLHVMGE